jgi:hypothetical protein
MRVFNIVRCGLRLHHWGAVIGDDWGAHQACIHCGHSRRLGVDQPPEAHAKLRLSH